MSNSEMPHANGAPAPAPVPAAHDSFVKTMFDMLKSHLNRQADSFDAFRKEAREDAVHLRNEMRAGNRLNAASQMLTILVLAAVVTGGMILKYDPKNGVYIDLGRSAESTQASP